MVNIKPIEEAKKILDLGPKEEVKKNTASGNINPLVLESLNEAPKVIDDNFLSARIDHQKEHKGSNLSYMVPDLTNSYDMGNGPKHIQHNIIHKMNTEMQKLLSTLSALDNECQSLRYQLHLSQSECCKAKLIANEQMNLSNTLRVQKEARERELESSKDTINSLQQTIKTKDKDIEKLAQAILIERKVKEDETQVLNKALEKLKENQNESAIKMNEADLQKLKQAKMDQDEKLNKMMKDMYSYQTKIVELTEAIGNRDNEIVKLRQKSEYLINSCMKIYCFLNLGENYNGNNNYEVELSKIKQTSSPHSGAPSVFESGDFYKNDFFKLVRDKFETKLKDITEKLAYSDSQRDQLAIILEK